MLLTLFAKQALILFKECVLQVLLLLLTAQLYKKFLSFYNKSIHRVSITRISITRMSPQLERILMSSQLRNSLEPFLYYSNVSITRTNFYSLQPFELRRLYCIKFSGVFIPLKTETERVVFESAVVAISNGVLSFGSRKGCIMLL